MTSPSAGALWSGSARNLKGTRAGFVGWALACAGCRDGSGSAGAAAHVLTCGYPGLATTIYGPGYPASPPHRCCWSESSASSGESHTTVTRGALPSWYPARAGGTWAGPGSSTRPGRSHWAGLPHCNPIKSPASLKHPRFSLWSPRGAWTVPRWALQQFSLPF